MSLRCLGNKSDLPLTSEEITALETYEAESDRGLLHNDTWHALMAEYATLYRAEQQACPGGLGIAAADPAYDGTHHFSTASGRCLHCGARREEE